MIKLRVFTDKKKKVMKRINKGSSILAVTILIIVGKLLGFVREVLIADAFGAGNVVDSFLMSESSAVIILGWLASFAVVFTPIYQDIRGKAGNRKADNYMSSLLLLVITLGMISTIVSVCFKEVIIKLCAPGFNEQNLQLTGQFFTVVVWNQILAGITGVLYACLNCINKRVLSNLSFVILGVVQLLGVVVARFYRNSNVLGWGLLASYVAQMFFLCLICKREGCVFFFKNYDKENVAVSIRQIIPVFISTMIADINVFFDRMFASMLEEGIVSVLHYASRIRILFSYVFSQLLITFFYPDLAEILTTKSSQDYQVYIKRTVLTVMSLFVPLTMGSVLLSDYLIWAVYGSRSFDSDQFEMMVTALVIYNISLPVLAIRDLFIRVLYVEKKSQICLYISATAVTLNIAGNYLLMPVLGYKGLAIATSLSAYFSAVIYYFVLKKEYGSFIFDKETVIEICKIVGASCIMGIIVYGLRLLTNIVFLPASRFSSFMILVGLAVVGILVFGILGLIFKMDIMRTITAKLGKQNEV